MSIFGYYGLLGEKKRSPRDLPAIAVIGAKFIIDRALRAAIEQTGRCQIAVGPAANRCYYSVEQRNMVDQ
jgi:hypothetical protein